MKKLSNTEAKLKKTFVYIKSVCFTFNFFGRNETTTFLATITFFNRDAFMQNNE